MRSIIKRRRSTKGQAAMEFLMTYGWAILAAIVAIGVLAYFGVFSSNLRGSNAILNNPYYAAAWNADATTGINIDIVNNGGDTLETITIVVTGTGQSTGIVCSTAAATAEQNPGAQLLYTMGTSAGTCTDQLDSGDTFTGDVVVSYNKAGSTLAQTSTGTISTPVQ